MNTEWTFETERISSKDEHGELIAEATFHEKANGEFDIDHTYVVPRFRGQGIADDMMKALTGLMREKGVRVTASCSYANAWLKKHKTEYADIISGELESEAVACRITP